MSGDSVASTLEAYETWHSYRDSLTASTEQRYWDFSNDDAVELLRHMARHLNAVSDRFPQIDDDLHPRNYEAADRA